MTLKGNSDDKTYKLRCEFFKDAEKIIIKLNKVASQFKLIPDIMEFNGVKRRIFVDFEVEFKSAKELDYLRKEINSIDDWDCHVAAQTIQPIENYNGERDYDL